MAGWTNESFMADLERDFGPDYDWNAVPDPDTLPDIYVVRGEYWREREPFYKYKTKEEADVHAGHVKKWSGVNPRSFHIEMGREKWQTEDHWSVQYRERYHFEVEGEFATQEEAEAQIERCKTWEGTIEHTLSITAKKPSAAVELWMWKEFRADILKGEKVFPMYLP